MGDLFTFECTGHTRAAASAVFTELTEAPRWANWGKPLILQSKAVRTGSPEPDGIGAVRAMGAPPVFIKEEITKYEQDRLLGYTLKTRAPVRNYYGEVVLTPAEDGTDISWRVQFEETLPGSAPLIRFGMHRLISYMLKKLTAYTDR